MDDEQEFLPDLTPLVVEVWYSELPDPTNPLLLDVLSDELGHAESVDAGILVSHEAGFHSTLEGEPAWVTTRVTSVAASARNDRPAEFGQCRGALVLTEELSGYLEPNRRVHCLKSVLEALARVTSPEGYWWPAAQVVTDAIGEDSSSWHGVINVRQNPSDVDPTGWVVDTIGLSSFDMPDLECHFKALPTELISAQIVARATGMASGQEYVADGDPVIITSAGGDVWLTARYRWARREPERRVIALIPDPDHALDPPEDIDFDD